MELVELLSLLSGMMTTGAPVMQAVTTLRTRDTAGLSAATFAFFVLFSILVIVIGLQYSIVVLIGFNIVGLVANSLILWLVSRKVFAGLFVGIAAAAAIASITVPQFLPRLLTQEWAEQIAFVYGILAAGLFLPQVVHTHRTKQVSSLSLYNLVLMSGGCMIGTSIAVLIKNNSLTFWNVILTLMCLELLRLKVQYGSRARRARIIDPA